MAYAKVNGGLPIVNGGAIGGAPDFKSTQPIVIQGSRFETPDMAGLEGRMDVRFIHGGGNSWERPGSNLPA